MRRSPVEEVVKKYLLAEIDTRQLRERLEALGEGEYAGSVRQIYQMLDHSPIPLHTLREWYGYMTRYRKELKSQRRSTALP